MAREILAQSHRLRSLDDDHIRQLGRDYRWQVRCHRSLGTLLIPVYALVGELARRSYDLSPYPVQMMGAITLLEGGVAEMQTGEGKTLTALMPVALRALVGRGCHVLTANDYLAGRDADFARPVLERLGLSVSALQHELNDDQRRQAYGCDVTYGTEKEFGFDFLRDQIRQSAGDGQAFGSLASSTAKATASAAPCVQRGHYFALVDEADSILIDQARTPLIISTRQPYETAELSLFRWCDGTARRLDRQTDFHFEADRRSVRLTQGGCRRVLLASKPILLDRFRPERIYRQVERALVAQLGFAADREYIVVDGNVEIVDESTGRVLEGRKWQDGLQQAIEIDAGAEVSDATQSAARVTVQAYLTRYDHLCGMTGTAYSVRNELKRVYGVTVTRIPTHRPCQRRGERPRVFATMAAKLTAIGEEIQRLLDQGRAILVGTPSIAASESLVQVLRERGIDHKLLHARQHQTEADIIRGAGQPGRVTVATNMAGRGTDIIVDRTVRENGGLHVIATEMHSSARIDRQLIGRAARQGDPGAFQFFVSLEDELLKSLSPHRLGRVKRRANPDAQGELSPSWIAIFRSAQRRLQRRHARQRRDLLKQEQRGRQASERMGLNPYLEILDHSSDDE